MGWDDWDDEDDGNDWDFWRYKPTRRREAKGGIKAKSQRGKIGETWWSARFIKILESFDIASRLQRGRSYARTGQVMDINIKPGLVMAKVQGSRPKPYNIRIEIEPLTDKDWKRAEKAMSDQAIFMAKLLAGEMPNEIEKVFEACNLSLFPASKKDIKTDCSCPDWSNPCKHIAATYYILAEKFDEDPFLIFEWRGRTKKVLIEQLRALRGSLSARQESLQEQGLQIPVEEVSRLDQCLNNFWGVGAGFSELHIRPQAAEIPDALLRSLGPAPIEIGEKNLSELLLPAYKLIVQRAERKALK
jgi:uncharacterized Zn finger protein